MEGDHFMGDKVPGKVKDNLPIIPDHVVDALEKGVDVPMEAFASGPAMEQLQDRMARRNDPVHAENLIPVTRDDPRIQPHRDGHTLPKVPSMRKVIPAPFRRPSAVMRQDHGRSWQLVRADQVKVGDIVSGFGKVTAAESEMQYELASLLVPGGTLPPAGPDVKVAVGDVVILSSMGGQMKVFSPSAALRAFARDGTGEVLKV